MTTVDTAMMIVYVCFFDTCSVLIVKKPTLCLFRLPRDLQAAETLPHQRIIPIIACI